MRSFIAINLPDQIKNSLTTIQDDLRKSGADVSWVARNNIHLTLRFLGDINDTQSKAITQILNEIAAQTRVFTMDLSGIGAFPSVISPRVIWIGIAADNQEIKKIAQLLEPRIQTVGIAAEKKEFNAHITLGRVRSDLNRVHLTNAIKELQACPEAAKQAVAITTITLIQSTLTPRGPIYETLAAASLATP